MRLSVLWRIMEIEEGVIGWITPSEISTILLMTRKPNSIMFYHSFEIIPSLKTWLKRPYLHPSIFSALQQQKQQQKYSPNSRCHPSSCLLTVLAMFLAIILPRSYSWNKWNVCHFCSHNQNNSTSSPGLLG